VNVWSEQTDEADHKIHEVVQAEPAVEERNVSGVRPIGNEDVVVRQQCLDGAPEQSRKVAREGRDDQNRRSFTDLFLAEMKQAAKRIGGDDLFGDGHLSALDDYGPNAEIRPVMRQAGVGQQLHRRRSASNERCIGEQWPWLVEETPESLGHQPNWTEDVVVSLVRLVKHEPSYIPIPSEIGNVLIETAIAPNHFQAKPSHLKSLHFKHVFVMSTA